MDRSLIARGLLYLALCFLPMSNALAQAQPHYITFTESSSSDLQVTSDIPGLGFTTSFIVTSVIPATGGAKEQWKVTWAFDSIYAGLGGTLSLVDPDVNFKRWAEPSPEVGVANKVVLDSFFDVFSDLAYDPNDATVAADGEFVGGFIKFSYTDDVDGPVTEQVTVRFVDNGDTSVPEPGMLSLIGLSLVALGWSRRRRAQG